MLELTPDFIKEFAVSFQRQGIAKRQHLDQLHVAERCGNACAFQRTDTEKSVCAIPYKPQHKGAWVSDGRRTENIDVTRICGCQTFLYPWYFCFSPALRHSHSWYIKELTTDDIVEVNGEKWIISKRHKTKVPFQVKLLDIPLQIIKRYEEFQTDKSIFPNLNYWSICKQLKKMIRDAESQRTFHFIAQGMGSLPLPSVRVCRLKAWAVYWDTRTSLQPNYMRR